jgi:hypothetical protein
MLPIDIRSLARLTFGVVVSMATGCCCAGSYRRAGSETVAPAPSDTRAIQTRLADVSDSVTRTEFHRVDFEVAPEIVLGIRYLRGMMTSTVQGSPIVFDDKTSFVIGIDSAEVGLSTQVLDHLMNEHVFAYRGAPLRNLTFSIVGNQLRQRGILHKGIDIPFELTATLSATPDGLIRVHPTAVKICSLDGSGLMRALRIQLADLLDLSKAKGASVHGNDLLLDPNHLLPPPMIRGHLVGVAVRDGQLVQTFGHPAGSLSSVAPAPLKAPDADAANYMYFQGGTLRFGKLSMVRADMQIIDLEPATPLAFNLDRYQEQLAAGYSKTGLDLSLRVFVPDYVATGMTASFTP